VVERVVSSLMFFKVTVAPGITAPDVSFTVPRMLPWIDWAQRSPVSKAKTSTAKQLETQTTFVQRRRFDLYGLLIMARAPGCSESGSHTKYWICISSLLAKAHELSKERWSLGSWESRMTVVGLPVERKVLNGSATRRRLNLRGFVALVHVAAINC